jgi:hypothetical protein
MTRTERTGWRLAEATEQVSTQFEPSIDQVASKYDEREQDSQPERYQALLRCSRAPRPMLSRVLTCWHIPPAALAGLDWAAGNGKQRQARALDSENPSQTLILAMIYDRVAYALTRL